MLYFVSYVSSASTLLSSTDIDYLLRTSRANNARLGLTGALLYQDGNLMQVLEGDEAAVRSVFAKISVDRRHHGVLTVLDGYVAERQFPDWSMAYRDLAAAPGPTDGYSSFLQTPLTRAEFGADPTLAQQLLISFKESLSTSRLAPAPRR